MIRRLLLCFPLVLAPSGLRAQQSLVEPDTVEGSFDPERVVDRAKRAQRDFERARYRHLPVTLGGVGGGDCDEYVGRFCVWYSEGSWYPTPESEEVVALRRELLAELDSLQRLAPADPWILGQRVWYRAEAGDWPGALSGARACEGQDRWWCAALEGLALHGLGRYEASASAFGLALDGMDPERARDWRLPLRSVDGDARGLLEEIRDDGPEDLSEALASLWAMADPLYLVDGNDRLTAHYARWTVTLLHGEARSPFRLSWGDDLEELTVRNGWAIGWERTRSSVLASQDGVTSHKHPASRDYMPPGSALRDPARTGRGDLVADRDAPRSLYAPEYAPVLLPMEGWLAVFPRSEEVVLVATAFLPADTTFHADHDHPRPWMEPGDQTGVPDRIGLFALPVGGTDAPADPYGEDAEPPPVPLLGSPLEARQIGEAEGALLLEVPAGAYFVSAESWSPSRRRAGRYRTGVRVARSPRDVATLSDLLVVERAAAPPTSLEEAVARMHLDRVLPPGEPFTLAWELSGLGFRRETLTYGLSVDRVDRGVLHRIGSFLGLADDDPSLELGWTEPAPESPTHVFRHIDLDLPPLEEGTYRITLTLSTESRSDVVTTLDFEVEEP